jgi:imidazolonepropionase-like amidohydrolase
VTVPGHRVFNTEGVADAALNPAADAESGRDVMRIAFITSVLLIGATLCATDAAQQAEIAFVDVTVIPMDRERVLAHYTVAVRNARIVAIGPAGDVAVGAGARRIDGKGKYLMPGLSDMHAHLGRPEGVEAYPLLLVANGVTTVRNMFGNPSVLALRQRIQGGATLGPQIYTTGPIMEGKNGTPVTDRIIETPAEAEQAVASDKEAGYDAIKVYNMLSSEVYEATMRAARNSGLPVYGHVPIAVGLERALAAHQVSVEHLSGYIQALQPDDSPFKNSAPSRMRPQYVEYLDLGRLKRLADLTRAAGVWNCPTLVIFQHQELTAAAAKRRMLRPEMKYMPPARIKSWEAEIESANSRLKEEDAPLYAKADDVRMRIVKALHDVGARLLLGTDFPPAFTVPGYSLHEELSNFVAAGLTPYEALRAGTSGAAEFLGKSGEFGVIAAGARADVVLLEANPLADVRNAAKRVGVMVRGEWYTEGELRERLDKLPR